MGGLVLLIGRIVFAFFFIYSGFNHLTKLSSYSQYAAASGVPAPTVLTAISGLMLLAGGVSILLGVQVRWGALLIAAFLVPAAFTVHKFWGIADPMQAANQAAHFWKNIALTGACMMICTTATLYPARWPYSLGRYGPAVRLGMLRRGPHPGAAAAGMHRGVRRDRRLGHAGHGFVQRDRAVHGHELECRAAGADRAAQVTRAHLAADFDREVGLDAPVHGLGIDVGVDGPREPRGDRAVDRREPHVAARQLLHVGVDAAVHGGCFDRAAGRIHVDAAVHRRRLDGGAHAGKLQRAVHGRGVDGDAVRQLHVEAHRNVVLAHAVQPVVAAVAAAPLARVPQRAHGESALGQHRHELDGAGTRAPPALLDLDDEAIADAGFDVDRTVGIADPHVLRGGQDRGVVPGVSDFAAAAEEVAAVAVAPVEIAERAERAEGRGHANFDAADEQAGAEDECEQHAAADELAAPRAQEPSDRRRMIE